MPHVIMVEESQSAGFGPIASSRLSLAVIGTSLLLEGLSEPRHM